LNHFGHALTLAVRLKVKVGLCYLRASLRGPGNASTIFYVSPMVLIQCATELLSRSIGQQPTKSNIEKYSKLTYLFDVSSFSAASIMVTVPPLTS
jgi:hypothetical protein